MSETAIRVENLSKLYYIGHKQERYTTLRDTLTETLAMPMRRLRSAVAHSQAPLKRDNTLWALNDVSFEVNRGDIVGIIGRNGAGKSTLLKILSRITEPTMGCVEIRGRVGSLLEVGTGFHPELTGRENIYLNGAILGMKRAEIERKFDEIVAFAEVEPFIDTVVKHYSSGMYLRLAFSVAAHLEPEVLVIDEVLAVGDAAFQQKCLGKMTEISQQGRTVLFVSHNMAAVSNLCDSAFLLDQGTIQAAGHVSTVIDQYLQSPRLHSNISLEQHKDRRGDGSVRFQSVVIQDAQGQPREFMLSGQDMCIALHYVSNRTRYLGRTSVSLIVSNGFGVDLFCCWSDMASSALRDLSPNGVLICNIPKLPLTPGRYYLSLALVVEGQTVDKVQNAAELRVEAGDFFATGKLPPPHLGNVLVPHYWSQNA